MIFYLESLPTKKSNVIGAGACSLVELKLDEDPKQIATEENKTELDFEGIDADLYDPKKSGLILSGYLHNEKKRVTIIS